MFIYWFLLLVALVVADESNEVCTKEKMDECMYTFTKEEWDDPNNVFPKEEFLDRHCSPILESLRCRLEFQQRCPGVDDDDRLDALLGQRMIDLITSMCDEDSEVRKGYLQNVECYDNTMIKVLICGVSIVAIVEDFQEEYENQTDFQHPNLVPCVGVPLLKNCIIDEIATECGSEETSPLAQILQQFTEITLDAMCPEDLLPIWQGELLSYLEEEEEEKKRKKK